MSRDFWVATGGAGLFVLVVAVCLWGDDGRGETSNLVAADYDLREHSDPGRPPGSDPLGK